MTLPHAPEGAVEHPEAVEGQERRPGDPSGFLGSPFGAAMLGVLSTLLGVSVVTAWVLASYFKVDIPRLLSFDSADGWCDPARDGVGQHCFGDWAVIRVPSLTADGLTAESVYPLSARLVRLPFMALDALAGQRATLLVFLAVSVVCLLLPAWWAARPVRWELRPVVIAVLGLITAPVLMVLDRGNILGLAIPFCFLAVLGLVQDRPLMVVVGTIAAASIKPQFALLAFGLVAPRHWRWALGAAAGSVAIVLLPFAMYGSRALVRLEAWINGVGNWSASLRLDDPSHTVVSAPRALWLLKHPSSWGTWDAALPSYASTLYLAMAVALAVLVVVLLLIAGRRTSPFLVASALLAVASLVTPLAFAYYQVFAVVVVALAFRLPPEVSGVGDRSAPWPDKVVTITLGCALALGLTPLAVPIGVAPTSLVPVLSTLAWLCFLVVLGLRTLLVLMPRRPTTALTP